MERIRGYWGRSSDNLPSNYWEPQPDEEDLERIKREYDEGERECWLPDEPIPFE
ncbi:hypothetical protein [Selenomonas ruminantium]|uniref:hypothetical protein n=1 Tax=Selenomonas ruminantium TaxID=971 RepID=UPI000A85173C|nr:hypothetical protein [Selenomonas ruminantium]